MGQQQLLLLVLSIVVVGATVILGVHALDGGKQQKDRSIVFQEALSIVAEMKMWKLKPSELGGGAETEGFKHITFRRLKYSHVLLSNRVHRSENGCYRIDTAGEEHHAVLTIYAPSCAAKDYVAHVVVRGLGPDDLDWQHAPPHGL